MKSPVQLIPKAKIMIAGSGLLFAASFSPGQEAITGITPEDRVVVTTDQGVAIGIHPGTIEDLNDYRSNPERRSARYHLGRPATEDEISAWDIDVSPDGQGLPAGSGDSIQGAALYAMHCAACHGPEGEGIPPNGALVSDGSNGKTIGSYWPYSTTVFDYIRRAMPFGTPGSLSNQEIYSLTAFLLYKNDLIAEDTVIDGNNLPGIKMPNADKFTPDNRESYNYVY